MLPEVQIKIAKSIFIFGLWRKLIQRVEKRLEIPVAKKHVWTLTEDCETNFFFFFKYITLETAAPENWETATHYSGKGVCVYATYRDRSVCAVACNSRCITGSSCFRFLFALRCCLNHSLFYSENFVSCVCRVLNIDEGTEISDRKDMHHASYQSPLSSTHHLGILSPTRRHHTSL